MKTITINWDGEATDEQYAVLEKKKSEIEADTLFTGVQVELIGRRRRRSEK